MKKKKYFLLLISMIFMLSYANAQKTIDQSDNSSTVILKIQYKNKMIKGFGGSLMIKNTKTGKVYKEQFKKGIHSYIKIVGLEEGYYKIEQLTITAGPKRLFIPSSHNCFNDIHIKETGIYFLGNYKVKKIPPTFQNHIRITEGKQPKEKDIRKATDQDQNNNENQTIITDQKLLKKKSTDVKVH